VDCLKLPFLAEHAQSERRLQIIEAEGLRGDLDQVFIDELIAAHAAYGEALGITKAAEEATEAESLVEPLRVLTQTIVAYALQVIAFAALSAENGAQARRALQPIDAFREAASLRGSGSSGGGEQEGAGFELPEGAPDPGAPMPVLPEE
jgi:hypothetical protein